jgi:predicted DNA-binding antitoxin AbrB/MazE fold protein
MIKTFEAIFDGQVLRPAEPLELKPNTRVMITIETPLIDDSPSVSFLDTALALHLEGPADWSVRLEDYLYGGQRNGSDSALS